MILFLIQSCAQDCDQMIENYLNLVEKGKNNLVAPKVYYFIPLGGCQKCVLTSIEFSKHELENNNIVYILVSQTGRKSITIHYNNQEINSPNIILDGTGEAYKQGTIGSNITIYYREENCYKREDVDPSNFDERLSFIKKLIKN